MGHIIYTAKFVKDIQGLLNEFPPKHKKVFGHHSTIAFKPDNLDEIEIGKESLMKVIGRVYDEKGDALLVENHKSKNGHPHITLSCRNDVPAVYSNTLIDNAINSKSIEYFENPKEIKVIEGYFDGKNIIIS